MYAKKKWNCDFYVITNNDIIFIQEDFYKRVYDEYRNKEFEVLGMDIYCPNKRIHQSPLGKLIPTTKIIKRTIMINKVMLYFFDFLYPIIYMYYKKIDGCGHNAIGYDKYQENVCVMGACMVLSTKYMNRREMPFWPETEFYYEEFLLSVWCRENNARLVYQPAIEVLHNEGTATKQARKKYKDRVKYRINCIINSAEVLKRELLKTE